MFFSNVVQRFGIWAVACLGTNPSKYKLTFGIPIDFQSEDKPSHSLYAVLCGVFEPFTNLL